MKKVTAEKHDLSLRDKLLDAAERLYAAHGFSAVSFRKICSEAGARNNYAIQYHFEDIEGLVSAILTRRTLSYEIERGRKLTETTTNNALTVRSLLEILEQPIIDLVDSDGERVGAKFMVALQGTAWGWRPLSAQIDCSPVAQQLIHMLKQLLPDLPQEVIWQRLYVLSLMIFNCASQIPKDTSKAASVAILENAYAMAAAAMQAPISDAVKHAMKSMYHNNEIADQEGWPSGLSLALSRTDIS